MELYITNEKTGPVLNFWKGRMAHLPSSDPATCTYVRLGICMHIMGLTWSMWKVRSNEMAKLKELLRRHCAVLCLSRSRVSERSGADVQVVSCHRYLVVFHPFVEQLTVFHTSESSTSMVHKQCVNPYISIVKPLPYIHTYIQAQPQTKTPLASAAPAQL